MKKPSCQTLLLVLWFLNHHFITSFSLTVNTTSVHLCSYDESHALLGFKNNFIINSDASYSCSSSSQPRTNSWHQGQDCCYWDGVTCDATTGEVIGLDLSCSGLQGQLSSNSSLFLLQHLENLNLARNNFNGSRIPPEFSQFHRLTHLDLSYSLFSGEVPIEISYLSNLVSLNLSSDFGYLTLKRHTMKSLVQNLTDLKDLNLDSVDLSSVELDSLRNISSSLTSLVLSNLYGTFPTSIFHLPNLQLLHLSNLFKGDALVYLPTSNWSTTSLRDLTFSDINLANGLPSTIGNHKSLKHMIIERCGISGSIPNSIGNLTSLEYLDLSDNKLVGSIPFSLYSLPLLRYLDFSNNQFTSGYLHPFRSGVVEIINLSGCMMQGHIPTLLFPYGANQLATLKLNFNSLNGTISSQFFTLPSLLHLYLGDNLLVGDIPEFKSTSLQYIDLRNNILQGNVPSSIFSLANLKMLDFSSNELSGTIDASMFSKLQSLTHFYGKNNSLSFTSSVNLNHSLPNLEYFYFSFNNVTEFPTFLRGSKLLFYLDLSNNKIDGRVPDWLWDVGRDTLTYLNLAHNNLTRIDKLPWTQLRYLDLRSNMLGGPLPLPTPPQTLVAYLISNNLLTGDILAFICNMTSMQLLDLSRNYFTGTIPECLGNISTLTVLDLSMNKFHGKILNFSDRSLIKTLNLNGNQLEGTLPVSLVNCKNLEVLDIGNNTIDDTFPHWLSFITALRVLVLKSNNFHGYVNDYKYPHSFQNLRIFDISNNNFVGSLPTKYIEGLEAMKQDAETNDPMYMEEYYYAGNGSFNQVSYYQDSVSLTIKGTAMNVERILTTFMTIDFSKNMFGGEIPQVFGTLISLKSLNLSHNNLVGHIPTSIGNLTNLESLDLSSNKLSGAIPRELASVTFLGKLNLSQNALVGPIPSTNNFDTRFDNSSYQENVALCGPPLSRTCSNETNEIPPPILPGEEGSGDFDRKIILYGYISGLVIGLSIGYMVFSRELPIWLVRMIQRYQQRKQNGRIQQTRGEKLVNFWSSLYDRTIYNGSM